MAHNEQLTFYTFPLSPYALRVHVALEESKAPYTLYNVNLQDKPEWFVAKVNPAGQIPVLSYGGPETTPESPTEDSAKITESLLCLEFLADLFPKSGLLPEDIVKRARVRFFIYTFEKEFHAVYNSAMYDGESALPVIGGLEKIQSILPEDGFAVGDFTIADAAAAPILAGMWMLFAQDIGRYPVGEGKKVFETLKSDPKFARLRKYVEDIRKRPSFAKIWDEVNGSGILEYSVGVEA